MRRVWLKLHEELARLSTNSDHRIVEGAGHYIHRDRPEAVVAAISDVVTAVKEGGRGPGLRRPKMSANKPMKLTVAFGARSYRRGVRRTNQAHPMAQRR